MNLEGYKETLFNKKTTITNRRQELLQEMLELINEERPYKYKVGKQWREAKKMTAKVLAIKVSHLKEEDLKYMISEGKLYKHRGNSFGRYFFGSLKLK